MLNEKIRINHGVTMVITEVNPDQINVQYMKDGEELDQSTFWYSSYIDGVEEYEDDEED